MAPQVGHKAPDFSAVDQDGNPITLQDFAGRKLALYFYPKDSTPGCTAQACNLRDNYASLQQAGYEVVGVSTDSPQRHRNFIAKNNLPFRLIADEDRQVHEAYGTWQLKKFMGREYMGTLRTTFLIDAEGVLREIIGKVKTKEHSAQILG